MSYRDDGDALLARNAALEAENARLRAQLEEPAEESKALVRNTPKAIDVPREPWYVRGFTAIVWVVAVVIGILTGVI